jgi:hypothetical protein
MSALKDRDEAATDRHEAFLDRSDQ